jgi:hypothetical protein
MNWVQVDPIFPVRKMKNIEVLIEGTQKSCFGRFVKKSFAAKKTFQNIYMIISVLAWLMDLATAHWTFTHPYMGIGSIFWEGRG